MRAVVTTAYGPPEVLQLQDLPKPTIKSDEMLVRVRAANVLAADCEMRRFDMPVLFWLFARLMVGVFKPVRIKVFGQEAAGEVTEAGKDLKNFKVGDKVFGVTGMRMGCHAEYAVMRDAKGAAPMPSNMSFEEACGLTVGGTNALHFLRRANIQPGQRVMIAGSTGSIGVMAVQLAREMGAEVHVVCGPKDAELVRSLGAVKFFDYTSEDFTQSGETYDVIFCTIGKTNYARTLACLKKGGVYLLGNPSATNTFRSFWTSMISGNPAP